MAENLLSERLSIIGTVDADAYSTTGQKASDSWDMRKWRRVMVVAVSGTFATLAVAKGTLYAGATSTGAWTTLLGKTFTMTEVTGTASMQAVINLSAAEVASTGKRWVKLGVDLSGASTVDFAAVILGDNGRYAEPWTTIAFGDLSTVNQIIA